MRQLGMDAVLQSGALHADGGVVMPVLESFDELDIGKAWYVPGSLCFCNGKCGYGNNGD